MLLAGNDVDHHPQRERDEVGDMRTDRNLPLEALPGKSPVTRERLPQRAFGFGRIAAEQPRQPPHRAALTRHPAVAVFRQQGAQRFGLFAVQHAAAAGPLRPPTAP